MRDQRLESLAHVLVHYSTRVQPGEFVFVSCDEACLPWMVAVSEAAIKAGAHVEICLTSQEVQERKLRYGSDEQLRRGDFIREAVLPKADVWLTAWGGRNTRINSGIGADRLALKAEGDSTWRRVFSERMGNGSLRWCGTQFPTQADAQEASMSLAEYEDFVYGAGLLDKEDPVAEWTRIHDEQEKWTRYLDTKKELHFVSEGTDLRVAVAGRKWINCAGEVNFPDGEVFTSPREDEIDGKISFSFPGIYMGKEIDGIVLEIEAGVVKHAHARKGEELLHSLLALDEGSSRFGEVAIGTNYGIQKFTRKMLFDEKIGGTIHLALGDSMPEAGGKNKSSIHWDMLCDMRSGGKIYADGTLFYENGKFLDEVLGGEASGAAPQG